MELYSTSILSDMITRYLTDTWADTDIHFAGDSPGDAGSNLYGCLKQLYLLKKSNRNLKVLLSIGGWTYSPNFVIPASTTSGRMKFATSCVSLVKNLGLDGIDVDWEYPADSDQATNFVLLLQAIRDALDADRKSLGSPYRFELTVACPAGSSNYMKLHLAEMDQYVDFWNLMAYDYTGSWSTLVGNQANLFHSPINPASTPFDTQSAVTYYTSQGIPARKIVLGMPLYGHSFESTGGLGLSYNGIGPGTWQSGIYDFKDLPLGGATEFYDQITGSSYSYDSTKKELITYDTVVVARQKAQWIQSIGLGGAMWWESSGDAVGDKSLIRNVVEVLRENGSSLENAQNELDYPDTRYDNLRAGMPGLAPSLSASAPCSEGANHSSSATSSALTQSTNYPTPISVPSSSATSETSITTTSALSKTSKPSYNSTMTVWETASASSTISYNTTMTVWATPQRSTVTRTTTIYV
jgi:chitinase